MSLSQERPMNPAKLFLKIKNGAVGYYDKELQNNIEVPTPFEFIVLDQLSTIKGWSDEDESSYWSNDVRSITKDIITVRTSRGMKGSGVWRDIKGDSSLSGAKYSASLYIAYKSKDGLSIANFTLTGAALSSWIDFTQKNKLNNVKVTLSDWQDGKKGAVIFKKPIFTATAMGEAEKAEAIELDKQLQEYLKEYFNYSNDNSHSTDIIEDVVLEDIDEKPIDLSEIPF